MELFLLVDFGRHRLDKNIDLRDIYFSDRK